MIFLVLGFTGLDAFFLFLLLVSFFNSFFLVWFPPLVRRAGDDRLEASKQASSRLDVQWMDGWMDCIWGWFLLSWDDMKGEGALVVGFGWMDRRDAGSTTRTTEHGIWASWGEMEACVPCVCVFLFVVGVVVWFLACSFCICAFAWMDGWVNTTQHHLHVRCREHSPPRV